MCIMKYLGANIKFFIEVTMSSEGHGYSEIP